MANGPTPGASKHDEHMAPNHGATPEEALDEISQEARPFGFAKVLSWVTLVLILASGLFLSIIIADSARRTLLEKQKEFASLLAENMNHQIYRRFTLPTIIGFGRIALRQEVQYERLDQVVRSTIHGLQVQEVSIYDDSKTISYSTNEDLVGLTDRAGEAVDKALTIRQPTFELVSGMPPLLAIFYMDMQPGTVRLRVTHPLVVEAPLGMEGERQAQQGAVMGVVEFTQDITEDYRTVVRFQWLIISTSISSSLLLFLILLMIIRRLDRVAAVRMKEKERLERELHQHEKLVSMGRMVASIAHEIRNPLGIIRSSAELLLARAQKEENAASARVLHAIHDETKRLSRTVNDFLDYARPKEPTMEAVDLGVLINQLLSFLERETDSQGVTVVRRYLPDLSVRGDKDLLYRALYNVITNALQAIPGEGTIDIHGQIVEEGGRKWVRIRVTDSGPGIDPALADKLLDPFYTTKDNGTGLGLAIAKNIVASHHGTLGLDNDRGGQYGGAAATIRLPYAKA